MKGRVILIVMDSVGIGELPDADEYGDIGSNTIGNIHKKVGLKLPNLCSLGLGNIEGVEGFEEPESVIGCYGRMKEKSKGKDTTIGHWEIAGIQKDSPLPTYPEGFPKEIVEEFEEKIGAKIIGNYPSSGTKILDELGEEHLRTGYPILYTSADSVFQVAAHQDVISTDELYKICSIARNLLVGEHSVGRVIARPFKGKPNNFIRTKDRKDFCLVPPSKTILDVLYEDSYEVKAVGKIEDIFAGKGISYAVHTGSNSEGMEQTIRILNETDEGLIFTNLVDFDMLYGHRNDIEGYRNALEEFDAWIPELVNSMRDDDLLIITADHGCDPTTDGTDHTREYVPLMVYGKNIKQGVSLGTRKTFSDIAATISEFFSSTSTFNGISFLSEIN